MQQSDLRSCRRRAAQTAWPLAVAAAAALLTVSGALHAANSGPEKTGGLVAYPQIEPGPNLLTNSGFEASNAATGKADGWVDNGFTVDTTVSRTGKASLRLTDPYLIPYAQAVNQDLSIRKGTYRIGAWVKLKDFAATRPTGVRLCLAAPPTYPSNLGSGCTDIVKGTQDWTYLEQTRIVITQDTKARFSISAYGEPDGSAWFDDVELREEPQVLDTFLLYPNYRGILFSDQAQTARFQISISEPPDVHMRDYELSVVTTDEVTGRVVDQRNVPAVAGIITVEFGEQPVGHSYLTQFRLTPLNGSGPVFTYPPYRIVKSAAAVKSLRLGYDAENRFLMNGKPVFLLGVYDSSGYSSTADAWASAFASSRRLFELPINLYLNIWYGATGNQYMTPMMEVLKRHGILNLTNANCFAGRTIEQMGPYWFQESSDQTILQRTAQPGFGGFYAVDECTSKMTANVFPQYQRMKATNPDGLVFGTLLPNNELPLWRDSVDVLGSDPYPISGPEPAGGYPLSKVADATKLSRLATSGSRPVMTTLQFFQSTSNSRWPTAKELRAMSYAAITEGANGLFFWTLGARGLAWVCPDWCDTRNDYFDRLKGVLTELRSLDPILTLADAPNFVVENRNPLIHTRAKATAGAVTYLLAYNGSNETQRMDVSFAIPFRSVTSSAPSSRNTPAGSSLSDTLGPNEFRLYTLLGSHR